MVMVVGMTRRIGEWVVKWLEFRFMGQVGPRLMVG